MIICKMQAALLSVPLVCGAAYANASSGNGMEGYHVVGTLAHGLAYTNASDVSAQNNWEWISPSVSSTMGLTYQKSHIMLGKHSYDLKGYFKLGYAESNVEHDNNIGLNSFAVRPDMNVTVLSDTLGSLVFSSMVQSTLGDGYVKGSLYSDNRWTEFTWAGIQTDLYPSMLQLNPYQDTGVKGASYTTPRLWGMGMGDGLRLFVSGRDKNRAAYGGSFEVARKDGMAFMVSAAYSPKTDVEAAINKPQPDWFSTIEALFANYDQSNSYYKSPWNIPQVQGKGQEYLISFKAPDNIGVALSGFWHKKIPKPVEFWTFNNDPYAYGVNASYQKCFGRGLTTLRLGYQKDSVRGISYYAKSAFSKVDNMMQSRWSVALTQPVMKHVNMLLGYNRYSIKGYPREMLQFPVIDGLAQLPVDGKFHANALFFAGMEYLIGT